jgi:hypothetical protein
MRPPTLAILLAALTPSARFSAAQAPEQPRDAGFSVGVCVGYVVAVFGWRDESNGNSSRQLAPPSRLPRKADGHGHIASPGCLLLAIDDKEYIPDSTVRKEEQKRNVPDMLSRPAI